GTTSQILTCSGDQAARFWNVDNGGSGVTFGGNKDFLYRVGVSPDGKNVAAGGGEGVVRPDNGGNRQLGEALQPPEAEVEREWGGRSEARWGAYAYSLNVWWSGNGSRCDGPPFAGPTHELTPPAKHLWPEPFAPPPALPVLQAAP